MDVDGVLVVQWMCNMMIEGGWMSVQRRRNSSGGVGGAPKHLKLNFGGIQKWATWQSPRLRSI